MNIVERARQFVQWLKELPKRSSWAWRRCPHCGSTETQRWGTYLRRVWTLQGLEEVRVPRHRCRECGRTYSETKPGLVRRSWYAREVQRCAVDLWLHGRMSLRRVAEVVRSWVGRQERFRLWKPWEEGEGEGERCSLAASTVHRWLDGAGRRAQERVVGQWEGVETSEQVGVDGMWVRLRRGVERVVLLLVDSVTGMIWPPVVVRGEKTAGPWERLFGRAREAGLDLERLRGVTSDGATGVLDYLRRKLYWVNHQRCVWHLWRNLAGELGRAVARVAQEVQGKVRGELVDLVHQVLDAPTYEEAEKALERLRGHPLGAEVGRKIGLHLDQVFFHRTVYGRGLSRVAPEWCWRDFRLRLSRGRNHGSVERVERAVLVWAIYHNFTPRQWRSERKRHYRYPGQSPLEVARASPGEASYLDALGV